jgi:3-oxoacyl-[acyl-carrier-protein] synthase-1
MIGPVHIVSAGARTALGLRAAPSAAAYRAGISAVREHPFMIDQSGDPMPGALDTLLDPAMIGPDRFLALAESALREACQPMAGQSAIRSVPMFVGLPEIRPGFTGADAEAIRKGLTQCGEIPLEFSASYISTHGHAAGLAALAAASQRMQEGEFDVCVVGGIDSYFHPDTMEWLDEHRQLAGAVARSAFVPGEGAGFCLLMTEHALDRFGLKASARVRSAATGRETQLIKTQDLCLGAGLTSVVAQAADGLKQPRETIGAVICDINGERYRGEEWGFVCLRLSEHFDDPTDYWSPADCWGDVGAASGPLFVMLACEAASRGYLKGPLAMLWASSENGLRAATIIDTAGSR